MPVSVASRPRPFVGVQCMPQSAFDEGAENMLDFMQREGGIETLCISTHVLHGGGGRPDPDGQADHGVPKAANSDKPLTRIWIPHDDANFKDTPLRMPQGDPAEEELAGRDVLAEVIKPAHDRGMRVIARHLEGFHHPLRAKFPAFGAVGQVDITGAQVEAPCWRHPHYRAFWHGYVRDVVKRYAVDGLYLGAERDGPFGPLFHGGVAPVCFCEHCRAAAAAQGLNADRAHTGMARLHELLQTTEAPLDGMFTSILRLWMEYPETLAWETLMQEGKWTLFAELYRLGKSLRPDLVIGWHLPMYPLNHDIFSRAQWDYARLAKLGDFLKPNLYFDVNAARLHRSIPGLCQHYLRDFSEEEAYDFLLTVLNMDKAREPTYAEAATAPFSPHYVAHEARRCVVGCGTEARAYAGIGVDVPFPTIDHQPEWVAEATAASLVAGAAGLLLSREYHFMTRDSLNAVRDTVNDWVAGKAFPAYGIPA